MVENRRYFDDIDKLRGESRMVNKWWLWVIVIENWQNTISFNVSMTVTVVLL